LAFLFIGLWQDSKVAKGVFYLLAAFNLVTALVLRASAELTATLVEEAERQAKGSRSGPPSAA
jgi:hypothetical protein